MDDKPRLFVLVATGQPVANLPPVLELAEPGDRVVWILSGAALRSGWALGPSRVLERYGLEFLELVQVQHINNPAELSEKLRPVASCWSGKCRPVLVANGGNKLTPIGLLRAFEEQKPLVVYNNDRPVQLWLFEQGVFRSPTIRPYQRHRLDLADVLEASGHCIQNPNEAEQLWPCDQLPLDLQQNDFYGTDPEYTRELHHLHMLWAAARKVSQGEIVPFEDVVGLLTESRIRKWKKSFKTIISDISSETPFEDIPSERWKKLYHATLNLWRDALVNENRKSLRAPEVGLGGTFEKAVTCRLWQWLRDRDRNPALQSVWRNVTVCHESNKEKTVAEFDLLLVLRNGLLLHIECKSSTAERKDLDARLLNLQRAGSRLAQMIVCVPIFTDFAHERWFRPLHYLSQLIKQTPGLHLLPFTLENQPSEYLWQTPTGKKSETISCPRFEDALEELIRPFEEGE